MLHSNVVELKIKCCTLMCVINDQMIQSNVVPPIIILTAMRWGSLTGQNGVDGVHRRFPWSMKFFGNLSMKFLKLELTIDSIPDNEHAGIILINATWITTMMNLEYLSIRMWCCFPLRMSWLKWNLWNFWNLQNLYLMMARDIHDVIQWSFNVSDQC